MRGDSRNRRAAASAGMGVAQRLVQVGCTLVLMPVLLHALGPARFGVWGAAASLRVACVACGSRHRFGAGDAGGAAVALDRLDEARRQVAGALTLGPSLGISFLVLTGVALGWRGQDNAVAVYLIAFAGLAMNLRLSLANNVWMAMQEGYFSSTWELVQTVVTFGRLDCRFGLYKGPEDICSAGLRRAGRFEPWQYGSPVPASSGATPERLPESWSGSRDVVSSGMMFFLMGIAGSLTFMLDNVLALEWLRPPAIGTDGHRNANLHDRDGNADGDGTAALACICGCGAQGAITSG